ncbi:lysophospholipid acyltransferase family protein [Halopseudomonas sabulinigri]|uniref:Lyso-ornithine lipid O-acyltransferase n=1 Tax=Halopseudomonas sabulinigri TaxID=472181 RepID=A0ABP9ZMF6_9GAMM
MTLNKAVRLVAVVGWIACGLLLATWVALLQPFKPAFLDGQRQRLTRWWMRNLIRLLPLRLHVHGAPVSDTALWVSNHVSWLDIVVLGAQAPVHFLSKAEVRQWPVIGWLAAAAGTCFIQRGKSVSQCLQQLTEVLQQGRSLVIFAEGTTTAGDRVRTFHGRLLGSAIDAAVPVQPVAVAYRLNGAVDQVAPFINDDEFSQHLLRLLGAHTIDVHLHFLPPLDSHDGNRNQLAREAQSAVSQALDLPDGTIKSTPPALSNAA